MRDTLISMDVQTLKECLLERVFGFQHYVPSIRKVKLHSFWVFLVHRTGSVQSTHTPSRSSDLYVGVRRRVLSERKYDLGWIPSFLLETGPKESWPRLTSVAISYTSRHDFVDSGVPNQSKPFHLSLPWGSSALSYSIWKPRLLMFQLPSQYKPKGLGVPVLPFLLSYEGIFSRL